MLKLNDQEQEVYKVLVAMQKFGGSFVKALAGALQCVDPANIAKIKATWPDYWQEYLGMYELIKDKYPIEELRKLRVGVMSKKIYLGDSVYAEYDGWDIILTTNNGMGASNTIILEPYVLDALDLFRNSIALKSTDHSDQNAKALESAQAFEKAHEGFIKSKL